MALSEFFTDDEVIDELRLFFDEDTMWDADFRPFLNNVEDLEDSFYLRLRGREFLIDKVTGSVSEVNPSEDEDEDEED